MPQRPRPAKWGRVAAANSAGPHLPQSRSDHCTPTRSLRGMPGPGGVRVRCALDPVACGDCCVFDPDVECCRHRKKCRREWHAHGTRCQLWRECEDDVRPEPEYRGECMPGPPGAGARSRDDRQAVSVVGICAAGGNAGGRPDISEPARRQARSGGPGLQLLRRAELQLVCRAIHDSRTAIDGGGHR